MSDEIKTPYDVLYDTANHYKPGKDLLATLGISPEQAQQDAKTIVNAFLADLEENPDPAASLSVPVIWGGDGSHLIMERDREIKEYDWTKAASQIKNGNWDWMRSLLLSQATFDLEVYAGNIEGERAEKIQRAIGLLTLASKLPGGELYDDPDRPPPAD